MKKVWKTIEEADTYLVSNFGEVMNKKTGRVLSSGADKDGYRRVILMKDGKRLTRFIHRLVAIAFIPNPENNREVNHIDEDKTNNNLTNLEWTTRKENANHGTAIQRRTNKNSKCVIQYNLNGVKIGEFANSVVAMDITGIHKTCIGSCCRGKQKTAGGFVWKFK